VTQITKRLRTPEAALDRLARDAESLGDAGHGSEPFLRELCPRCGRPSSSSQPTNSATLGSYSVSRFRGGPVAVGRPGLEPGTLGLKVHPDRCGGVLKRLASSQICRLNRAYVFRARRSGTVADAFGSRMLGECWVGDGYSAGVIRPSIDVWDGSPGAPGIGTEARRTVSQAGGNSHISEAACERRYSRKYGKAKST
jgi:hypothetical protein